MGQLKPLVRNKVAVEPKLAAAVKLLKWLETEWNDCEDTSDAWEVLGFVRSALGQGRRQMDGMTYGEMRSFLRDFMSRHGLD